jgi:hypothetical protein
VGEAPLPLIKCIESCRFQDEGGSNMKNNESANAKPGSTPARDPFRNFIDDLRAQVGVRKSRYRGRSQTPCARP